MRAEAELLAKTHGGGDGGTEEAVRWFVLLPAESEEVIAGMGRKKKKERRDGTAMLRKVVSFDEKSRR